MHHISQQIYFHFLSIWVKKHFIRGLNAVIERIAFEHNMHSYTLCCACISMCIRLFSVDGIHVYRCTTHPVSLVGSELRVTVCVCVCLYERVCACLSGNWRCGPIWGVSKQAGESHAGCSLGSVLMEFNPDLSSPRSSQCPIIIGLLILPLHSVCVFDRESKRREGERKDTV